MQIEWIHVASLSPWGDNPRIRPADAEASLRKSIAELGLFEPLVVWGKDNIVLSGNQRRACLLALHEANMLPMKVELGNGAQVVVEGDVPCVRFHGSWAKARVVALRANTHDGDWDWDELGRQLAELANESFDMDLTGFDESVIADLVEVASMSDTEFSFDPVEPEPVSPPTTEPGARFVCGSIRGKLSVELYHRILAVFESTGKKIGRTDVPAILTQLLKQLED